MRTLRFEKNDGVTLPSTLKVVLHLSLPGRCPSRVVLFGDLHAVITEQGCNPFDWDGCSEEFSCKTISEPVGMSTGHLRKPKKFPQSSLPTPDDPIQGAAATKNCRAGQLSMRRESMQETETRKRNDELAGRVRWPRPTNKVVFDFLSD
jgi:hypothetical protein